jgi:hypothetical protein
MCPIYSDMPSRTAPIILATQVAIGIWGASLQPVWAQSTASDLFRVAPRDQEYGRWLTESFGSAANGWRGIWRRSVDMGATLAPFLDQELEDDKDREHRLVLTGAYSLAAQNPHSVLLGKKFAGRKRYRFMVMFALALGPRHGEGSKAFLRDIDWKRLNELEQVVVCMALARLEDRGPLPKHVVDKTKSPGVLAAALYCRPGRRRAWVKNRTRRLEHQDLVWRGYLLGDSCSEPADGDRTALALAVLGRERAAPAVMREAAWYLARSSSPASVLDGLQPSKLPLDIRLLLCHSKPFRGKLLALQSTPPVSVDNTLQRRWFALYSRFAPMPALRRALVEWQRLTIFKNDVDVQRAIGLALAERLMRMPPKDTRSLGLEVDWLMGTDVGPWLRLGMGESVSELEGEVHDVGLRRVLKLMIAGRLPRARAAAELHLASWRDGPAGKEATNASNPGLMGLELHRQLLGELVIDGAGRFVDSGREPYKAAGLGRSDTAFEVAIELFKFIRREEPWSAREHRLPN